MSYLPGVTQPRFANHRSNRNIFTHVTVGLQLSACLCFTIGIATEYWNHDPQSGFNHSLWKMLRCDSFKLSKCSEIKPGEDSRVLTLQILSGFCYAAQIVALFHTLTQYCVRPWYTRLQAIISVSLLTFAALTFIIGFAVYFQRTLSTNFGLELELGFSAHLCLASILMVLIAIGIYGIEIARRSVPEEDTTISIRNMRELAISGPPPKRDKLPPEPIPPPGFSRITTAMTGILYAAAKLHSASKAEDQKTDVFGTIVSGIDQKDQVKRRASADSTPKARKSVTISLPREDDPKEQIKKKTPKSPKSQKSPKESKKKKNSKKEKKAKE